MNDETIQHFHANVSDRITADYKPIGDFRSRGEAEVTADAMTREMPWTKWEACLDGTRFRIRRTA